MAAFPISQDTSVIAHEIVHQSSLEEPCGVALRLLFDLLDIDYWNLTSQRIDLTSQRIALRADHLLSSSRLLF